MFLFIAIFVSSSSLASSDDSLPSSTISAAPALLPDISNHNLIAPSSNEAPTLSPDISPLFPSPGGSELSPTESSEPLIPSSPSPPNPDQMVYPGPAMAPFASSGLLPDSYACMMKVPVLLSSVVVLLGGILVN